MDAKEFHAWASQRYAPAPAPAPAATIMGNAPLTTTPAPPVPSAMEADDKISPGQGSETGAPSNGANATSEALVPSTPKRSAAQKVSTAAASAARVAGDGVPGASPNASGRVVQGQTPSTSGAAAAAAVDDYQNTILGINLESSENAIDSLLDTSYSGSSGTNSSVGSVALKRQQNEARKEFFHPSNKTRNVIELVEILGTELDPELGDDERFASSMNLSKMLAGGVRAALAATPGSATALGHLGKEVMRTPGAISIEQGTRTAKALNAVGQATRQLLIERAGVDVMQPPTREMAERLAMYLGGLQASTEGQDQDDLLDRKDLQLLAATFAAAETALDSVPEAALAGEALQVLREGAAAGQARVGLAKGLPEAVGARFEGIVRAQFADAPDQANSYHSPWRSKRARKEPQRFTVEQEEARGRELQANYKIDQQAAAASKHVARLEAARAKAKAKAKGRR